MISEHLVKSETERIQSGFHPYEGSSTYNSYLLIWAFPGPIKSLWYLSELLLIKPWLQFLFPLFCESVRFSAQLFSLLALVIDNSLKGKDSVRERTALNVILTSENFPSHLSLGPIIPHCFGIAFKQI